MSWFNILKKLTGKAKGKGSTLDASKIKVNVKQLEEDGPCKKRLKELIIRGATYSQIAETGPAFPRLPEETACHILELIKKYDQDIDDFVEDIRRGYDKGEEWTKDHEIHIYHSFYKNGILHSPFGTYHILVFEGPWQRVESGDVVIELELNKRGYEKWSQYI